MLCTLSHRISLNDYDPHDYDPHDYDPYNYNPILLCMM